MLYVGIAVPILCRNSTEGCIMVLMGEEKQLYPESDLLLIRTYADLLGSQLGA